MGSQKKLQGKGGFVLVLMAGLLALICALAALAIDVTRAYGVRAELQHVADAAALAGAAGLYPVATYPVPSWGAGQGAARNFAGTASVGGSQVDTTNELQVSSGYWNPSVQMVQQSGVTPGVCADTGAPCTTDGQCPNSGCFYVNPPGVEVTVTRTVPTTFAKFEKFYEFQPSATAVAVLAKSGPSSGRQTGMPPGTVFPFAIFQPTVDAILNGSNPGILVLNPNAPNPGGQWCDLGGGALNANTLTNYINYLIDPSAGNAPPVVTAGTTRLSTSPGAGTMATAFGAANNLITAGKGLVFLPILQNNGGPPIVSGFARVQLMGTPSSTITGRLVLQKLIH